MGRERKHRGGTTAGRDSVMVRIPRDLAARLDEEAARHKRARSGEVELAVEAWLAVREAERAKAVE